MEPLDKFGQFAVRNLRDKAIKLHLSLMEQKLKGDILEILQSEIAILSEEQKELINRLAFRIIDDAIHEFLFALQEAHDFKEGVEILVDGSSVAEVSGMLHGEPLGDQGWIKQFSQYPDLKP